jgi:hypothetical protein
MRRTRGEIGCFRFFVLVVWGPAGFFPAAVLLARVFVGVDFDVAGLEGEEDVP